MMNPIVGSLKDVEHDWIGHVDGKDIPSYIDYGLLLIFGGIPWQVRMIIHRNDCDKVTFSETVKLFDTVSLSYDSDLLKTETCAKLL